MRALRAPLVSYAALWCALVAGALFSRPPWPIDETRYLSVAWEMWQRGDFLVPYLNGTPYSHKPPLLFWLIHLGWQVFGVNAWWPRLVPALFALASVVLTARLARRLWPALAGAPRAAVWILAGSLLWIAFTTLLMFDMLVVFFVLLAIAALVDAARGRTMLALCVFGLALGLGMLAKGPVVLVYTVPPALAAPWWSVPRRPGLRSWYGAVLLALAAAFGLALAWVLPAVASGGPDYANAILWRQTAGRVIDSFAHSAPWWWYLPLLPLILFPWPLWPALWRAAARLRLDFGARVTLSWMAPAFIGLSLVSGKQPHYLLPLFPAFALLAGAALAARPASMRPRDVLLPATVLAAAGLAWLLAAFGLVASPHGAALPPEPGVALIALALALALLSRVGAADQLRALALAGVAAAIAVYVGALRAAGPSFDLRPVAARVAALARDHVPLARVGAYYGEYQFLARLPAPLAVIAPEEVDAWLRNRPNGRVIVYLTARDWPSGRPPRTWHGLAVEYAHPFRAGSVLVAARPRVGTPARLTRN